MTDNKQNIPQLRFPEFSGEWEEKKLGDVFKIGSGRDYKHLQSGNIPVYGTGGYMLSVNEYLYDGESVCIGRKGTIDKPVFLKGKFWTVDTLFYTHSFQSNIPSFIFLLLQKINWKLYNEASGVPSLSKATIEKIVKNFPKPNEQTKIAEFLMAVDSRVENLQEKKSLLEDYKKGVMQKNLQPTNPLHR
jgi:type I restriction enzyme S subunit